MISAVLLAVTLSVVSADSATPPAKNYTFDTSGTTKEVQAGKKGELKVHIKAAEGYKVSSEAPLKIALEAKDLDLAKKQLGHDDAKDKKSTAPEFLVSFAASAAGDKAIMVDALFFVCSEKICERKTEKVTIPVSVRP
jgi:hypothetical protein